MTNITVVGNCYNPGGSAIDILYKIFYPHKDLYTPVLNTVNNQLIFNTSDKVHLGYNESLREGEPLYIIGWEVDYEDKIIRRCRKRIKYSNEAVINNNIMLYDNLLLSTDIGYDKVENEYTFKPNVISTEEVSEVIYSVYYDINQVHTDSDEIDYKLIKTISKETTEDLFVKFTKSGKFKITCEVVVTNNEVSETSEILVDVAVETAIVVGETNELQQSYIEWE